MRHVQPRVDLLPGLPEKPHSTPRRRRNHAQRSFSCVGQLDLPGLEIAANGDLGARVNRDYPGDRFESLLLKVIVWSPAESPPIDSSGVFFSSDLPSISTTQFCGAEVMTRLPTSSVTGATSAAASSSINGLRHEFTNNNLDGGAEYFHLEDLGQKPVLFDANGMGALRNVDQKKAILHCTGGANELIRRDNPAGLARTEPGCHRRKTPPTSLTRIISQKNDLRLMYPPGLIESNLRSGPVYPAPALQHPPN